MALQAVTICSSRPEKLSNMQKLSFADIRPDSSFNYKYIEGTVTKLCPLQTAGKFKRMKLIIREDEVPALVLSPSRINVFLIGGFAEEFLQFSEMDKIIISEARIEKSPTFITDFVHPCNILVDRKNSRPSVWVIPNREQSQRATNTGHTGRNPTAPSTTVNRPSKRATNTGHTGRNPTAPSTTVNRPGTTAPSSSDTSTQRQGQNTGRNGGDGTNGLGQAAGRMPTTVTLSVSNTGGVASRKANPTTSSSATTTSSHPMNAWTVPNNSSTSTTRSYTYTLLKDLKETSQVNIFGTVKFFKPPYKTRGPDYTMTVTLIDPTLDPNHRGLRCQLFRDSIQALPQVHNIGDIVRFHRLKITRYNGELQGQIGFGFHCLVFDGEQAASLDPRSSSPNFTLTDDNIKRVKELRLWSNRETQLAIDNHSCTLTKMYSSQYFDLTCQVVSVATLPAESCVVVSVWDGTHYRGHVRVMDISAAINTQSNAELASKSEGLAVDVSLYDNHMETGSQLKPGQYIKICNLHAAKFRQVERPDNAFDMVELVVHHGTSYGRGVILLNEWEQGVKDMIKRMEEVNETGLGAANQNSALTVSGLGAANQNSAPTVSGLGAANQNSAPTVSGLGAANQNSAPTVSGLGAANQNSAPTVSGLGAANQNSAPTVSGLGAANQNSAPSVSGLGAANQNSAPTVSGLGAANQNSAPTVSGLGAANQNSAPTVSGLGAAKQNSAPTVSGLGAANQNSAPTVSGLGAANQNSAPTVSGLGAAKQNSAPTVSATTPVEQVPQETGQRTANQNSAPTVSATTPVEQVPQENGQRTANQNSAPAASVTAPTGLAVIGASSANGSSQGTSHQCMQQSASVINDSAHQRAIRIEDVVRREPPGKYNIRAKVKDYLPYNIKDFVHLCCSKCRFKCRVPLPHKSAPSVKTSKGQKDDAASRRQVPFKETTGPRNYDLRSRTSRNTGTDKPGQTNRGVHTRSAASVKDTSRGIAEACCPEAVQRLASRHQVEIDPSKGSSKKADFLKRRATLRSHSASRLSTIEEEVGPTPRKKQKGTLKMASGPSKKSVRSEREDDRGRTLRDVQGRAPLVDRATTVEDWDGSGHRLAVGMLNGGEHEEGEKEAKDCRKGSHKCRVDIDGLSVGETLSMAKRGRRLVSPVGLTASECLEARPQDKVGYLCPRCSPRDDGQPQADNATLLQFTYWLKLILDDGTGSIEVVVDRENAVTFFKGVKATNLHTALDDKVWLEKIMAKLCPLSAWQAFDDPSQGDMLPVTDQSSYPWLECAIMSYPFNLGGKEATKHMMIDTTLALTVE